MKTIQTYPITLEERQVVEMPKHSQILGVKRVSPINGKGLTLIARANNSEETEKKTIQVYETGAEVNEYDLHYIGSEEVFTPGSKLVHVFLNK